MKPIRVVFGWGRLALLGVWLFRSGADAAENSSQKRYSTNAADQVACERQMNFLYGAIQEYQNRYHKLPRWLSDLVPEFIDDPEKLICPFVRATGNVKKWREGLRTVPVFGDPKSTYGYELCLEPYHGSTNTIRDYKYRQMEVMGFSVPIVRCLAHKPALNLGYDGTFYQSHGEWEDIFITHKEDTKFFHQIEWMVIRPRETIMQWLIHPRQSPLDPRQLDLSTRYNALLTHLSQVGAGGNLLVTYPEGLQTFGGVDFDIRGLIQLTAKDFPLSFPVKVEAIKVEQKCARIHFLHGTASGAAAAQRVATFVMHLADGSRSELPILYGKDVKARWFDARQKSELENPKPAWVSPADKTGTTGRSLRLYQTAWQNPHPEIGVDRIDLISELTAAASFVVAISLDQE
jgi:hypothetical protein